MQTLKNFFYKIWYWRKNKKFNEINQSLEKAVENKTKKQRALKLKIMNDIREYLGIGKDDISKYIPYDYKTRLRVQRAMYEKYGEEMKHLNVSLNDKLKLL